MSNYSSDSWSSDYAKAIEAKDLTFKRFMKASGISGKHLKEWLDYGYSQGWNDDQIREYMWSKATSEEFGGWKGWSDQSPGANVGDRWTADIGRTSGQMVDYNWMAKNKAELLNFAKYYHDTDIRMEEKQTMKEGTYLGPFQGFKGQSNYEFGFGGGLDQQQDLRKAKKGIY